MLLLSEPEELQPNMAKRGTNTRERRCEDPNAAPSCGKKLLPCNYQRARDGPALAALDQRNEANHPTLGWGGALPTARTSPGMDYRPNANVPTAPVERPNAI